LSVGIAPPLVDRRRDSKRSHRGVQRHWWKGVVSLVFR
jgi:hypothetical protein